MKTVISPSNLRVQLQHDFNWIFARYKSWGFCKLCCKRRRLYTINRNQHKSTHIGCFYCYLFIKELGLPFMYANVISTCSERATV